MMADVVAIQNNSNNNISEAVAILNKVKKKLTESGLGYQQFVNSQLIFLNKNEAIF